MTLRLFTAFSIAVASSAASTAAFSTLPSVATRTAVLSFAKTRYPTSSSPSSALPAFIRASPTTEDVGSVAEASFVQKSKPDNDRNRSPNQTQTPSSPTTSPTPSITVDSSSFTQDESFRESTVDILYWQSMRRAGLE